MSYIEKQKSLIDSVRQQVRNGVYHASIISEQIDYEPCTKISLTSVCIPTKSVKERIQKLLISPLRKLQPNYYYCSNHQLHLTIKNIRIANDPKTFASQNVKQVQSLFAQLIPEFPSFNINLRGLLSFPTSLSVIGYTNDIFGELVRALDYELIQIGVPDDKIYISNTVYFGNCTICRYQGDVSESFKRKINDFKDISLGCFKVKSINLLSCNPVFKARTSLGDFHLKH